MGLTKVKINLGTQGNLSGSRSIVQSTKTLVSGSAQIASNISGSFTSTSSSIASGIAGNLSSINTLNGSGTAQGVGTSDSPTFNNITATGTLTAQEIHTEFTSASIVFTSGSTKTGNSTDDIHQMTGSLNISGSLSVKDGALTVDGGNIVFNEDSVDQDFRVESNGNTHMLFVDGGNNRVGIGTSNPTTPLEVVGSGDTYVTIKAGASDGNVGFLFDDSGGNQHGFLLYDTDDDYMYIGAGNAEAVRIKSDGKVGIGTASPGHLLTVAGATDGDNPSIHIVAHSSDSGSIFFGESATNKNGGIEYDNGGQDMYFTTNSSRKMTLDTSGNLGIGHTTPQYGLTMAQGNADGQKIGWEDGGNTKRGAILVNSDNDSMEFMTGASDTVRMRIDSVGNTTIGTFSMTNPHASYNQFNVGGFGVMHREAYDAYITSNCYYNTSGQFIAKYAHSGGIAAMYLLGGDTAFNTYNGSVSAGSNYTLSERVRITAAGYFKAGNLLATDYSNYDASVVIASTDHSFVNRENSSYVIRCYQTHASNPYGIIVKYSNADVSNESNHFFVGAEDNQDRFQLRSNGGLANVQSNNADLSDERTKKDITDTSSQYDFIKSLRVRNFKYKVDNDDDRVKTGVIAQEVESIDSSLIDNTGTYTSKYVDEGENTKLVYDKDIYFRAIKALQEAMEKIETLETQMAQVSGSN